MKSILMSSLNSFIRAFSILSTLILPSLILPILFLSSFTALAKDAETQDTKSLTQQQIKEDFQQLYADLQVAHYDLFANHPKEQYDRAYTQWLSKIDGPMTHKQVRILFQQFMALGDIAHSRIDLPMQAFMQYFQQGGTIFPAYFQLQGKQAQLDILYSDDQRLEPGQEVIAVNGTPIQQWLTEITRYISSDNRTLANTIIERTLPIYVWLMLGEQPEFDITVKTTSGVVTATIPAVNSEQRDALRRAPSNQSEEDLSKMDAGITDSGIAWLRPGPFYNTAPGAEDIWDNTAFVEFIDAAYEDFIANDTKALIIDLRNNPGGTNSFSDPVIAWFADKPFRFASEFVVKVSPQSTAANQERLALSKDKNDMSYKLAAFYDKHQSGQTFTMSLPNALPRKDKQFSKPVYVLINRYSYSNAVSFAAIVKDYGFATVIGEKTADLATTYGAMEHFALKHSGITVGYPKALIVRPNGDRSPDGVTPDISLTESGGKSLLKKALEYVEATL